MTWGGDVEKYRALCMRLLHARAAYYCLGQPIMSDAEYDRLEDGLKEFERIRPELRHPLSPTGVPGSDNPSHYPRSIQRLLDEEEGVRRPPMVYRRPVLAHSLQALAIAHQEVTGQAMQACNLQILIDERMIDQQGNAIGA